MSDFPRSLSEFSERMDFSELLAYEAMMKAAFTIAEADAKPAWFDLSMEERCDAAVDRLDAAMPLTFAVSHGLMSARQRTPREDEQTRTAIAVREDRLLEKIGVLHKELDAAEQRIAFMRSRDDFYT